MTAVTADGIPVGWQVQLDAELAGMAETTRRINGLASTRSVRDDRAVQLDRTARHRLVAIVHEHGGTWLMGGPESWSKDELVAEILRAEFPPEVTR